MNMPIMQSRTVVQISRLPLFVSLLWLMLTLSQTNALAQEPTNLLRNPGFEGDFHAWSKIPEVQMAHEWTPWWVERQSGDPQEYNHRPEYKQAQGALYPDRVHGGSTAQQFFTFYSTHTAGFYQQVFGIQPGTRLQFSIWAQVWSSSEDDPKRSDAPADMYLQVGIDPTGNWDPWAGSIVWSAPQNRYDEWGTMVIEATAQADVVTVFVKSAPNFPVKHNDTYWDDAALIALGTVEPTLPPPTATPVATIGPITETPNPPETASPTPTMQPTATCAPPPENWDIYTVVRGDYLTALAQDFNTTLADIIAYNCLSITTIYPNQQLWLPPAPTLPTETALPSPSSTIPPSTPAPTITSSAGQGTSSTTPQPITPIVIAAATLESTATSPPTATPIRPTASPTALPTSVPEASGSGGGLCGGVLAPGIIALGLVAFSRKSTKYGNTQSEYPKRRAKFRT